MFLNNERKKKYSKKKKLYNQRILKKGQNVEIIPLLIYLM